MGLLPRILLALAAVFLDGKAVVWLRESGEVSVPLLLHLLAVGAGALVVFFSVPANEPKRGRVVLYLLPVMLVVPVFGPVFACGLMLLGAPGSRNPSKSRRYLPLSELLPEDLGQSRSFGVTVRSIVEIMRGGSPEERRRATLALKDLDPADSLPILRRLTQDDDEIVRLFALGERRRVTNEFEERSRRLARKRKEKRASVSELLLLAESYLEEVEIGLPADELQRRALLDKTLEVLWEARRHDPERMDIEFDILRCALAAFDVEVAERAFHRLRGSGAYRNRLTLQHCEYLFQTGNWKALMDELFALPDSYRNSPKMERVLELWDPAIQRLVGAKAV